MQNPKEKKKKVSLESGVKAKNIKAKASVAIFWTHCEQLLVFLILLHYTTGAF